jgi:hypothetical protein
MIRSIDVPFAIAWPCAMRGRDHVFAGERGADPGRGCLLADRDVQEAGKLARSEAVLDLLLEATDEKHLAEEPA